MRIKDYQLLDDNVEWKKSPNHGSIFDAGTPDSIIIHYTAGGSAESSVDALCDPDHQASAHLVISKTANVFQLVEFNKIAWHAGKSYYGNRKGYNKFSIGIEIDNAGVLTLDEDGDFSSWFGRRYSKDNVIKAIHCNESSPRYWEKYTEPQIKEVFSICNLLCRTYPIKEILGHDEIAPERKTDPGPAFPMERLKRLLNKEERKDDSSEGEEIDTDTKGIVATSLLNIRKGPGTSFDTAASPLTQGTEVEILEKDQNWLKVRTWTQGWVSSQYINSSDVD